MPFAIAAGIGAAGAIGGSLIQSSAAKDAASKANAAQQRGLDQANAQYEQARTDLEPWRTGGGTANTATADLLGLNGPDAATAARANFQASPGYQWSLDQGLRAVDAGAAAKGLLRSGATLKAEQTFGTGLADQEFTNYYNRLFDLSKLGEGAAGGSAGVSQNAATASQNAATGMAQTDLSLGSAQTSIYGNAAQGLGNAANSYLNNRRADQTLDAYNARTNALAPGGSGGGYVDTTSTFGY